MVIIPRDKKTHFLAGYGIALTVALIAPDWYGFLAGVSAGLAKEAYDYFSKRGTTDKWDALATMLGALAGEIIHQFYN